MVSKAAYLEKLLEEYERSFDIIRDYKIGQTVSEAYGFFSTVSEKFVISPKANLWSALGFEHILFLSGSALTEEDIREAGRIMTEHMEPELVRRGKKYPQKDHMYSYVTIALLTETKPSAETVAAVRAFRYEKNYLMTIRGYVEGHMILMDLSCGKAYANKPARHLTDFYERIFCGLSA